MTRELEVFFLSCHNIGRGLNEVVRKVLEEYDAGLIPEYMASTGKTYKSHAATICRWAKEDRRKGKGGISDYSCKEGESL